jgi:membrane-associated phospholipid phosphatase
MTASASNTSPTPLIVVVGAPALRRWRLAAALVLVVPCKLALERVVKLLVQRERPGTTVGDVHPGGLSVVSGHGIITFAIAGLLALVLPRRWARSRVPLLWCAGRGLGALSRGGPCLAPPPHIAADADQDR